MCRAELPITVTLGNAPVIDVWINDRPARRLLDTGAARSALLMSAAARFDLGTPAAREGVLTGIGGVQSRSVVPIRSVAFGYVHLGPISADVLSMGRLSDKVAADGCSSGPNSFDGLLGVGPALVPARMHRFASIVVDPEKLSLPETEVASLSFARPEMVLGMDFPGTHKVWIDYAGRTVHFVHYW